MAIAPVTSPPIPPAAPPAPPPPPPAPPSTPAPAAQTGGGDKTTLSDEKSGSSSGLGGYLSKLGDTFKVANTRLDLSDEQRQQVAASSGTLKKLAGPDGKWNADDLADNVQAMKPGFKGVLERAAGPKVAEGQLRNGFEEMTGKEVQPLTDDQKAAAKDKWDAKSPEEQKSSAISRKEMDRFRETMDMIKDKSAEKGLPESKFEGGMPANLLDQISENQPAWKLKLNSLLPQSPTP